jgi:DNA-directed RNA polymerase subunit alpha
LSVRSHNCLKAAGIQTVGELVSKTEQELLNYRNFGQKSLTELSELVKNFGLSFGMDVDRYLKVNRK